VTKLPLLARIHVATPCTADWSQMTGDERVRHCAHCKKDVFNLSDMSRAQAERLIIEMNGDLCARYYQRKDGTILLADCSVGLQQKRRTGVLAAGAAMLLAGAGGMAGYLRLRHHEARLAKVDVPEPTRPTPMIIVDPPQPPEVREVKGDVGIAPPEAIQGGISMPPH
jgi:hypothetical protein